MYYVSTTPAIQNSPVWSSVLALYLAVVISIRAGTLFQGAQMIKTVLDNTADDACQLLML